MTAVLAGETAAMIPVGLWRHAPLADQQADSLAAATCAIQTAFNPDFIKLTPASTWQSRDHGLGDAWDGDIIGRRTVTARVIYGPEDWLRLRRLDPRAGFTGRIVAACALARRDLPPEVPLLATVFNPLFQAAQLAGPDRLKQHLADYPGAVRAGLDTLRANTLDVIAALAGAGAEGIFLASQHACASAFDAGTYAALALSDDLACLESAAILPFSMVHLHGHGVHAALFATQPHAMLHYEATDNPSLLALAPPRGVSTGPSPHGAAAHLPALCGALKARPFFLTPGCTPVLSNSDRIFQAMIRTVRRENNRDVA